MRILVLPISGGTFPVQLGILCALTDSGLHPDLVLATSGGAVSAYTALAGEWAPGGIEKVAAELTSELFIESWWPDRLSFLPSGLLGLFKGSLYQSAPGITNFFNLLFTPEKITATEIWVGTTNITQGKAQFFCNLSKDKSRISPVSFKQGLYNCLEPLYLEGHLPTLAKVTLASASVPLVVAPQQIGSDHYVDGGVFYASPLTVLKNTLSELTAQSKVFHLDYIMGSDLNAPKSETTTPGGMLQNFTTTASTLIQALCLHDRAAAVDLLKCSGRPLTFETKLGTPETLKYLTTLRESPNVSTVVEYFPTKTLFVDEKNFTGSQVLSIIREIHTCWACRIWWVALDESSKMISEESPSLPL